MYTLIRTIFPFQGEKSITISDGATLYIYAFRLVSAFSMLPLERKGVRDNDKIIRSRRTYDIKVKLRKLLQISSHR